MIYRTPKTKSLILTLLKVIDFIYLTPTMCRSQWPRGLRRRSAAARLLRTWVRIPPGAWMFVCCECCVFSGRGLCDELITRPEESYRLWCVVVCDLETSWMRRPWPALGRSARENNNNNNNPNYVCVLQHLFLFVLKSSSCVGLMEMLNWCSEVCSEVCKVKYHLLGQCQIMGSTSCLMLLLLLYSVLSNVLVLLISSIKKRNKMPKHLRKQL